jgi:hypothetical protein
MQLGDKKVIVQRASVGKMNAQIVSNINVETLKLLDTRILYGIVLVIKHKILSQAEHVCTTFTSLYSVSHNFKKVETVTNEHFLLYLLYIICIQCTPIILIIDVMIFYLRFVCELNITVLSYIVYQSFVLLFSF